MPTTVVVFLCVCHMNIPAGDQSLEFSEIILLFASLQRGYCAHDLLTSCDLCVDRQGVNVEALFLVVLITRCSLFMCS